MKVSDIMTKNVVSIGSNETVQKTIALMEKHNIKEVPVLDEGKLAGMVRFHDIITIVKASPNMKSKRKMIQPPTLGRGADVNEATELILNTGIECIPVLDDKSNVVGVVTDYDILKNNLENKAFKQPVGSVMKPDIPTCKESDTLGDARKLMDFDKIDRIPVVDRKNRFIGMVLQIDLLRKLYIESYRGGRMDLKSGIKRITSFPVKGMMRQIGKGIRLTDRISDALELMLSENLRGLVILNMEDEPVGVLYRRDVLSLLSKKRMGGFIINLSGSKLDDFENQRIISLVSEKMNKLYKIKPKLKEIKIHIKEIHGSEESKGKYEVIVHIIGPRKPIQTNGVGFDPMLVIDELLDNIERLMKE